MQGVLTIIAGVQSDFTDATNLCGKLAAAGRIQECRIAGSPRGLSVILLPNTSDADRLEIANEFKALGYGVIEVP